MANENVGRDTSGPDHEADIRWLGGWRYQAHCDCGWKSPGLTHEDAEDRRDLHRCPPPNRLHELVRQACRVARAEDWTAMPAILVEALAIVENA